MCMELCDRCGREIDIEKLGMHDGQSCRLISAQLPKEVHRLRAENADLTSALRDADMRIEKQRVENLELTNLVARQANRAHVAELQVEGLRKIVALTDQYICNGSREELNDVKAAIDSFPFDLEGHIQKPKDGIAAGSAKGSFDMKSDWAICGWCAGTGKAYGLLCPKCESAGGRHLEKRNDKVLVYPMEKCERCGREHILAGVACPCRFA